MAPFIEQMKSQIEKEEADFVSVTGPSGSGKTTLLNIIGLMDKSSRGSLVIDKLEINNQDRQELARLRRELIGFVFQSFNLLPVLNVFENVKLPMIISKKALQRLNAGTGLIIYWKRRVWWIAGSIPPRNFPGCG